jgi:DNA-binding response OmpR family regulator
MENLLTHREQSDKTVLVCDPDFISSTLVASMVKNKLGYKCITVSDGRSGARMVRDKKIDLIITEVYLPYLGGCAMMELIRNEIDSNVPVLFLSSHLGTELLQKLSTSPIDGFAKKPIHIGEVISKISSLLRINNESLWVS